MNEEKKFQKISFSGYHVIMFWLGKRKLYRVYEGKLTTVNWTSLIMTGL